MTSNTDNGNDVSPSTLASSQDQSNERVQAGVVNKTAVGQLTVTFPRRFSEVPTVVVTPFWQQASAVGAIETINRIDQTSFTINSNNAAPNYFVTWIAYGR